jgi:outer membrane receptor protein involved in Fe transport
MRRIACICLVIARLCVLAAHADQPTLSQPVLRANIPRQDLATALATLARQTGLQLVYVSDVVGARKSQPARAGWPAARALARMLAGTGLRYEFLNARTVRIYAPAPADDSNAALADTRQIAAAATLDQVVVTATRRAQDVDRLPANVVLWSAEAMAASGAKGLPDLGALTPGVEFDFFSTVGSGIYTNMAIRGVTDRHGTATGVYLDGIALPPVRSNTFGRALPLVFDLDRVEVLRGPQGTMLGANTQGGAVGFIPTAPGLDEFHGLTHAEWGTPARGGPSYEAGAALGGPLRPQVLGFRLSGWYRVDGGFIDRSNPFTGAVVDPDSNRTVSKSLRGALAYQPTPRLHLDAALNYVASAARDSASYYTYLSEPGSGVLRNGSLLQQPFMDAFVLGTVHVVAALGRGELDTVTGYFHRSGHALIDDTESRKWGGWGNPLGPEFPVDYRNAVTTSIELQQRQFSQDVRYTAAADDGRARWTAGVYFADIGTRAQDGVQAQFIPVLGGPLLAENVTATTQTQLAAYGQFELALSRHLRLGTGLRIEREFYDARSYAAPAFQASDSSLMVAPKLTLSYETGAHQLSYFTAAKGYAPAGVDPAIPTCFLNPTIYPADTLWSYELGAKRALYDGRLHIDASVFHVRWDNGVATTGNCLFTHQPGMAVSNGADLQAELSLGEHDRVTLTASYVDAHYAQTVLAGGQAVVHAGDAVGTPPLVTSPLNLRVAIEHRMPMFGDSRVTLRAEDVYHSRNSGPFYTSDPASPNYAPGLAPDPATNVLNLQGELKRAQLDFSLRLSNALDSQPVLLKRNKGVDVSTLFYATTLRPRTLTASVSWHF